MSRRAVFLDKDGTLIEDLPYNVDPSRIALAPFAGEALQRLHSVGFALVVVSNQSGVALGRFEERALHAVRERLQALLADFGLALLDMYWCPHHPQGTLARYALDCACRKPKAGLLRRAAREHDIDLNASWMVGDILDDVEAGRRAGCSTVMLDVGNETQWKMSPLRRPQVVAPNLRVAAEAICAVARNEAKRDAEIAVR